MDKSGIGMVQEAVTVQGGWGRRPRGLCVVFRSAKARPFGPGSMSGNTRLGQAIWRIVFPRSISDGSFFATANSIRTSSFGNALQAWEKVGIHGKDLQIFLSFPAALRPGALRSAAGRISREEISEVDLRSWLIGKQEGLIRILV